MFFELLLSENRTYLTYYLYFNDVLNEMCSFFCSLLITHLDKTPKVVGTVGSCSEIVFSNTHESVWCDPERNHFRSLGVVSVHSSV